jgi:hypothetical protein
MVIVSFWLRPKALVSMAAKAARDALEAVRVCVPDGFEPSGEPDYIPFTHVRNPFFSA